MCPYKDLFMNAHSSFICNSQMSTTRGADKLWYIYTMEHDSALRKDSLLIHTVIWVSLSYAQRKETEKEDILYDSIYIKFQRMQANL